MHYASSNHLLTRVVLVGNGNRSRLLILRHAASNLGLNRRLKMYQAVLLDAIGTMAGTWSRR